MLKVTFAVLAVALAGTASAGGWRKLSIDGSSEAAFKESVATFQDKLSPSRRAAFDQSLQDIWLEGTERALDEQREYTSEEYFRQLDGLSYADVIRVTDPTGKKAQRYRAEYYYARQAGAFRGSTPNWRPTSPFAGTVRDTERIPYRGGSDLFGPGPGAR